MSGFSVPVLFARQMQSRGLPDFRNNVFFSNSYFTLLKESTSSFQNYWHSKVEDSLISPLVVNRETQDPEKNCRYRSPSISDTLDSSWGSEQRSWGCKGGLGPTNA